MTTVAPTTDGKWITTYAFGVAVGTPRVAEAGSVLDALCDNLRSIEDLTEVRAAADLFRVI